MDLTTLRLTPSCRSGERLNSATVQINGKLHKISAPSSQTIAAMHARIDEHARTLVRLNYKTTVNMDPWATSIKSIDVINRKPRDETLILLAIADKHIDWETTWI